MFIQQLLIVGINVLSKLEFMIRFGIYEFLFFFLFLYMFCWKENLGLELNAGNIYVVSHSSASRISLGGFDGQGRAYFGQRRKIVVESTPDTQINRSKAQ